MSAGQRGGGSAILGRMGAHHHRRPEYEPAQPDAGGQRPAPTAPTGPPGPPGPMSLTFLGAAGTVTGSKYLLALPAGTGAGAGERRVLVDAGMFQGEKEWRRKNWEPFPVDPATFSDVVLTHAHMDHSGYLPALVRQGFAGSIHCTAPTRQLAEIVLRDSAYLQEKDAQYAAERGYSKHDPPLALYGMRDVERTLPLFRVVDYDTDVELGDGLHARFTRAGHILGSASVRLSHGTRAGTETAVLFSGDLGRDDHPVLRARQGPQGAPYVVNESTYGDREHPDPAGLPHEAFAAAIRRTAARGGSVLVPAFAVDRTEIVITALGEMRDAGRIPDLPIYIDSPMAIAALKVYKEGRHRTELRADLDPEHFLDLRSLREAATKEESMALNDPRMPSIVISSSGMATGGRVLHHLERMLPDNRNTVVLTGYQSVGTRGRALADGAEQLKMHGGFVPVRAEIVRDDEFSVHADSSELVDWLRALRPAPRAVFVAHGEQHSADAFARRIRDELGLPASVPGHGESVALVASAAAEPDPAAGSGRPTGDPA